MKKHGVLLNDRARYFEKISARCTAAVSRKKHGVLLHDLARFSEKIDKVYCVCKADGLPMFSRF